MEKEKVKEVKKGLQDLTLEELTEIRQQIVNDTEDLIKTNEKIFTANYDEKAPVTIDLKTLVTISNHLGSSGQQFQAWMVSIEDFMAQLRRAFVAIDINNQQLRLMGLKAIQAAALSGELKEIKEEEKKK